MVQMEFSGTVALYLCDGNHQIGLRSEVELGYSVQ